MPCQPQGLLRAHSSRYSAISRRSVSRTSSCRSPPSMLKWTGSWGLAQVATSRLRLRQQQQAAVRQQEAMRQQVQQAHQA